MPTSACSTRRDCHRKRFSRRHEWRIRQAEQVTADMIGVSAADWKHLHPDDLPLIEAMVRGMMETGFGVVRCRNFTRDGSTIHCDGYNTVLQSGSGEMISVLSQVLDVSEQVKADALLADSNTRQTRIAQTLQQSLLLAPPADAFSGIELGTLYEAARDEAQVGGDFFDAFSFWDNKVCLMVGDVTGKGLAAARFTAEVKYALRAYIHETTDVARSLILLNRFLCTQRDRSGANNEPFVAIAVAILDTETGQGACSLAGMEPPLIYRARTGRVEPLSVTGLVLGAMREAEFDTTLFTLEPGDWLTLVTDGMTEARDAEKRFWDIRGVAGCIESALREAPDISPHALARRCLAGAKAWGGGRRLNDDACVLMARFVGAAG